MVGGFPSIPTAINLHAVVLDARFDHFKSVLSYYCARGHAWYRSQWLMSDQHMPGVLLAH